MSDIWHIYCNLNLFKSFHFLIWTFFQLKLKEQIVNLKGIIDEKISNIENNEAQIKNIEAHNRLLEDEVAEKKNLDADNLFISHTQVNRAPPGRRRTYRAHGRIGKYASQPAHIQIILKEKPEGVEKMEEEPAKLTKKQAAKRRFVKVGAA